MSGSTSVRLSGGLVERVRARAKAENRSMSGQVEYWASLGEIAEDNPDLPFSFIRDMLIGREEARSGEVTPYVFGEGD